MKSFAISAGFLLMLVAGIVLGVFVERQRPIPAGDVQFDGDNMQFVRK